MIMQLLQCTCINGNYPAACFQYYTVNYGNNNYSDFTHILRALVVEVDVRKVQSHCEASDQQSNAQSEEDIQNSHHKGVLSIVLGLGVVFIAFCIQALEQSSYMCHI